jgi:hypothetical protein
MAMKKTQPYFFPHRRILTPTFQLSNTPTQVSEFCLNYVIADATVEGRRMGSLISFASSATIRILVLLFSRL